MTERDDDLIRVMAEEAGAEEVLADRADRRRKRQAARRKLLGDRAQLRLVLVSVVFLACFGALGGRMAILAASEPAEPRISRGDQTTTLAAGRRAIVDRNGRLLAVDLPVHAIYAHPRELTAAGVVGASSSVTSVRGGLANVEHADVVPINRSSSTHNAK